MPPPINNGSVAVLNMQQWQLCRQRSHSVSFALHPKMRAVESCLGTQLSLNFWELMKFFLRILIVSTLGGFFRKMNLVFFALRPTGFALEIPWKLLLDDFFFDRQLIGGPWAFSSLNCLQVKLRGRVGCHKQLFHRVLLFKIFIVIIFIILRSISWLILVFVITIITIMKMPTITVAEAHLPRWLEIDQVFHTRSV